MVEPCRLRPRGLAFGALLLITIAAAAQKPETFQVRLAPVSMDTAMKLNIAGLGKASAVLTGNKLTVNGTFAGLLSPATSAQIRRGSLTGVRGPVILDLKISPATISSATSGTVSGAFELTPDQVDGLRKGQFYIQIASEKAPDGNLWGWLLK